jgi:8-oxo-dGTP diphosphatase
VAVQRLREDLHFRPIGFELLDKRFSIPQLQRLYESILDIRFDRRNFQKKMLSTGILVDTGEKDEASKHRAGMLYEFNKEQYDAMKRDGSMRLEF